MNRSNNNSNSNLLASGNTNNNIPNGFSKEPNTEKDKKAVFVETNDEGTGILQLSERFGIDPDSVRELFPDGPTEALKKLQ